VNEFGTLMFGPAKREMKRRGSMPAFGTKQTLDFDAGEVRFEG
jgi:hypothetical protein